jgi:multidrug efflux pump subunit AcrA (membrane-fusion protein)
MTSTEPSGSGSPSRARWIFVGASVVLLSGTFALFALAPEPATQGAADPEAAAVLVDVLEVRHRPLQRTTRLSAVVEARRRVELTAETGGRVLELGAEEFDAVEADQVLVQLDPLLANVAIEKGLAAVARA